MTTTTAEGDNGCLGCDAAGDYELSPEVSCCEECWNTRRVEEDDLSRELAEKDILLPTVVAELQAVFHDETEPTQAAFTPGTVVVGSAAGLPTTVRQARAEDLASLALTLGFGEGDDEPQFFNGGRVPGYDDPDEMHYGILVFFRREADRRVYAGVFVAGESVDALNSVVEEKLHEWAERPRRYVGHGA